MQITEVVVMLGMFVFWAWVVYIILEWRRMKHKSQMQHKIIEKFGAVQELNDFLQSESGNKFMNFLTIGGTGPKEKLLSSISKGVILSIVGAAFFVIGPFFSEFTKDVRLFQAIGIVVIALGVGFLVSTFISYQLSKKWGLIKPE
ncbi:MAG: hypothetical protein KAW12_08270 [Candidatus Aminicenantes bacterium]|nr:hypothetical protein [Candidatus Aminicenantes bacterium]